MKKTAITIARPKSAHVRLTDARDAAHILVNSYHFDLSLGAPQEISSALTDGANVLLFVITTQRFKEKVLNLALDRPQWSGRFELFINNQLVSVFQDHGAALLGGGTYPIAKMDLTIFTPVVLPQAHELVARLRSIPGMTDARSRHVAQAQEELRFQNQVALLSWKNRFGVDYIFVTDQEGACVYGGYVGWVHAGGLRRAIEAIRTEYALALA